MQIMASKDVFGEFNCEFVEATGAARVAGDDSVTAPGHDVTLNFSWDSDPLPDDRDQLGPNALKLVRVFECAVWAYHTLQLVAEYAEDGDKARLLSAINNAGEILNYVDTGDTHGKKD
jgi:hypothetical protein